MDIQKYKDMLIDMQEELLDVIRDDQEDSGKLPIMEGDEADRAEVVSSQTIAEGLTNKQQERFEAVRSALERIQDNLFGKCKVCGNWIEEDRLDAIPYAVTCKEHMKIK